MSSTRRASELIGFDFGGGGGGGIWNYGILQQHHYHVFIRVNREFGSWIILESEKKVMTR